jgi:parvulin-like peptidyl-prolyl isomerase
LAGAVVLGCATGQAPAQGRPPQPVQQASATVSTANKPAAMVNGETITMGELETLLKRQPAEVVTMPETKRLAVRRIALGTLVDDMLRHQFLRKVSAPVAKAEIDKKLAEMSDMLKQQGKALDDFYKDTGETPEGLRTAIGYQLQWVAYCNTVATDETLLKFFDDNKDFFDGVMVEASHIVLRVPEGTPEKDVATKRAQLLQLRKDILERKVDFAAAAKLYSECESAPRGGQIGCIPRKGIVDEPFAKAAFALKVGDVSDVVQSGFGLHLIKVTDRKAGTPSDFKAVKEKVRLLFLDELDEQILLDLRRTAKIETYIP